ncbi:MAG: MotA/TolQ/ExbB proton channel family protein [Phycisphaeraceae bacterium]|nr:MotA/TolQ/ExbB proton channel family protein [Phycisphaeraceae bacterium]
MLQQIVRIFDAGGWAMYPLLALSILSVAASLERIGFWRAQHGRSRLARVDRAVEQIGRGELSAAAKSLKGLRSVHAELAQALLVAARSGHAGPAQLEQRARERIEAVRPRIERFSVMLSSVITGAPMLGILGTVLGIISSFRVLETTINAEPSAVAGGIAEALITTAFGLIVALVALFPYMYFKGQIERAYSRLEVLSAAFMVYTPSDAPLPRGEPQAATSC